LRLGIRRRAEPAGLPELEHARLLLAAAFRDHRLDVGHCVDVSFPELGPDGDRLRDAIVAGVANEFRASPHHREDRDPVFSLARDLGDETPRCGTDEAIAVGAELRHELARRVVGRRLTFGAVHVSEEEERLIDQILQAPEVFSTASAG
jgi:hypothetical protein